MYQNWKFQTIARIFQILFLHSEITKSFVDSLPVDFFINKSWKKLARPNAELGGKAMNEILQREKDNKPGRT